MRCFALSVGFAALLLAFSNVSNSARAAFHLWQLNEVFSNADGSVQFIELFTSSSGQTITNGTQIKSNANTFTFNANLSQDTFNKHLLLATPGFGALAGGVAPDFTIPAHFFSASGDTLSYVGTIFGPTTFGAIPTDGVHSRNLPGSGSAVNSPTNLAGASGSVNIAPEPSTLALVGVGLMLVGLRRFSRRR
jgi:serralysin